MYNITLSREHWFKIWLCGVPAFINYSVQSSRNVKILRQIQFIWLSGIFYIQFYNSAPPDSSAINYRLFQKTAQMDQSAVHSAQSGDFIQDPQTYNFSSSLGPSGWVIVLITIVLYCPALVIYVPMSLMTALHVCKPGCSPACDGLSAPKGLHKTSSNQRLKNCLNGNSPPPLKRRGSNQFYTKSLITRNNEHDSMI